jgi:hypothetical protein
MEVSCQFHALTNLTQGKAPSMHWIGGWVGLRVSVDTSEKTEISCSSKKLRHDSSVFPACSLITIIHAISAPQSRTLPLPPLWRHDYTMTGRTTNCGLILNSCKKLISHSKHPVWLWGPFRLYSIATEGPLPGGTKWLWYEADHSLSI